MKRYIALALICLAFASCSNALTDGLLSTFDPELTFSQIRNSPENHLDEQFMWGGFIVSGKHKDAGTFLEIVQNPIDVNGLIIDPDVSDGRFIAFFPDKFLDPSIYERGRLITTVGFLINTISGDIANKTYTFPVLEVTEVTLWKSDFQHYRDLRGWYNDYRHMGRWDWDHKFRRSIYGGYQGMDHGGWPDTRTAWPRFWGNTPL